jgi:hypothetical protein
MGKLNSVHGHKCVIEYLPNGNPYCADCVRKEIYAMEWASACKRLKMIKMETPARVEIKKIDQRDEGHVGQIIVKNINKEHDAKMGVQKGDE